MIDSEFIFLMIKVAFERRSRKREMQEKKFNHMAKWFLNKPWTEMIWNILITIWNILITIFKYLESVEILKELL